VISTHGKLVFCGKSRKNSENMLFFEK